MKLSLTSLGKDLGPYVPRKCLSPAVTSDFRPIAGRIAEEAHDAPSFTATSFESSDH